MRHWKGNIPKEEEYLSQSQYAMRIGRCCYRGHHLINIYCIELVENREDIVNIQTTIDIKVQPEQRLTTAKLALLGSLLLLFHVLHHLQPFHGHCQ